MLILAPGQVRPTTPTRACSRPVTARWRSANRGTMAQTATGAGSSGSIAAARSPTASGATPTGALRVAKVLSSRPRAARRDPRAARARGRGADPAVRRAHGHDARDQRAARAEGRAVRAGDHAGLRRPARDRDQTRPSLFALAIRKPALLYREVLEVDARAAADGQVLARPRPGAAARASSRGCATRARRASRSWCCTTTAAASSSARSARSPREAGFAHVALSHEVAPEMGTARARRDRVRRRLPDAAPARYVAELRRELPGSTPAHHAVERRAHRRRPLPRAARDPVRARRAASSRARTSPPSSAQRRAIGFDMGGTSTDVSRVDAGEDGATEFERVYETEIAGRADLRADARRAHRRGGRRLAVPLRRLPLQGRPRERGRRAGPALLRRPRRARAHPDRREPRARPAGRRPLPVPAPARARADRATALGVRAARARACRARSSEIASGFLEIANANMAEAIRQVSVARGYDVREYALVVFGGAGGQHACALARRLGIRRVLVHPLAGVLSAYGMGLADVAWHGEADAGRPRSRRASSARSRRASRSSRRAAARRSRAEGFEPARIEVVRAARPALRRHRDGADAARSTAPGSLRERFDAAHARAFGYARPEQPVEATVARVEVLGKHRAVSRAGRADERERAGARRPRPRRLARVFCDGAFREDVPVYEREALAPGTVLAGPALVLEATSTLVVDPGFELALDGQGRIVLSDRAGEAARPRAAARGRPRAARDHQQPVHVDRGADGHGAAPHRDLDQHPRAARLLLRRVRPRRGPGRQRAAHPRAPRRDGRVGARGASPRTRRGARRRVRDQRPRGRRLAPARHHRGHAGARRAGRAALLHRQPRPPRRRRRDHAGLDAAVLAHARGRGRGAPRAARGARRAARRGTRCWARSRARAIPARNPRENLADLAGEIAANRAGARLLLAMVAHHGLDTVLAYMGHVQDNAAAKVADEIAKLARRRARRSPTRSTTARRSGSRLRVRGRRLAIDFAGSGRAVDGNLNAPRAVTRRRRDLRAARAGRRGHPAQRRLPAARSSCTSRAHSLLAPDPERAVCGGNVETSQRVVDVLLGALGRLAASQGTMNNLTFGNERFGYYETIAAAPARARARRRLGRAHPHDQHAHHRPRGAREPLPGAAWSSSRCAAARAAQARWRGGDGVVRELEFLEPMRVSILSERRDPRAVRPGRRRAGRARPEHARGPRRRREGVVRGRRRRARAHRDTRRWRLRGAGVASFP